MAGLLDFINSPQAMDIAQGLLAAGRPTQTPQRFGQVMGQGMQAYQAGQAQRQALAQQQAQAQQKAMLERRFKEAQIAKTRAESLKMVQPRERQKVQDANGVWRWIDSGEQVFSGISKAPKPPATGMIPDPEKPGSFKYDPMFLEGQMALRTAGKPETTVTTTVGGDKRENKFQETMGEFFGAEYSNNIREGSQALSDKARYGRAEYLMKNLETGKINPSVNTAKALAKSMGVKLEDFGLKDDVGFAEALQAVTVDLTMDMASRTKGAISDREMALFEETVPRLGNTEEGNKLIIHLFKLVADRKIKKSRMSRDYYRKHKKYDEGFYDVWDKYSEENPLFTEEINKKIEKAQRPPLDTFNQ